MGTYCQEVNQEVTVADLSATRTFTCPLLVEKTLDVWKKAQIVDTQVQYTFEVAKIEEIFDFPVKEKFITFPKDHWIPSKDLVRVDRLKKECAVVCTYPPLGRNSMKGI